MIRIILPLAVLLFAATCSSKRSGEDVNDTTTLSPGDTTIAGEYGNEYDRFMDINGYSIDSMAVKPNQLQVIDSTMAVIINPTIEQMADMEEEYGEDFPTVADDAGFYQANAMITLDSLHVKARIAQKRYLKFQGDGGKTWLVDIRMEGAPEWNIIFFHTQKTPRVIPAIDVDRRVIQQYFNLPPFRKF